MDMKEKILAIAQRLIQTRGVNGFSYADIAREVGVSKPSLHHHFPTKADLVARLMAHYTEQLETYLASVSEHQNTTIDKLKAYTALYRHTLDSERICLGGMLSAEALTLDAQMLPLLRRFFDVQRQWLIKVLTEGTSRGELQLVGAIDQHACTLIAALQGALVVSRSAGSVEFFDHTVDGLLSHWY